MLSCGMILFSDGGTIHCCDTDMSYSVHIVSRKTKTYPCVTIGTPEPIFLWKNSRVSFICRRNLFRSQAAHKYIRFVCKCDGFMSALKERCILVRSIYSSLSLLFRDESFPVLPNFQSRKCVLEKGSGSIWRVEETFFMLKTRFIPTQVISFCPKSHKTQISPTVCGSHQFSIPFPPFHIFFKGHSHAWLFEMLSCSSWLYIIKITVTKHSTVTYSLISQVLQIYLIKMSFEGVGELLLCRQCVL